MMNSDKTPRTAREISSKKMVNNKITITRLIILGIFFFIFTWGGHWIGSNLTVILPIFNCEYVGGGTTRGLCIAIIDFNKRLTFQFLFSILCAL